MARPEQLRSCPGGFIFIIKTKTFQPHFQLCMMGNVIPSQILPILDRRLVGMAQSKYLRDSLGGFKYDKRKGFDQIFAFCLK